MPKDYEGCPYGPDEKHVWDLLNLEFKPLPLGPAPKNMDKMTVFCKYCLMTAERSFK